MQHKIIKVHVNLNNGSGEICTVDMPQPFSDFRLAYLFAKAKLQEEGVVITTALPHGFQDNSGRYGWDSPNGKGRQTCTVANQHELITWENFKQGKKYEDIGGRILTVLSLINDNGIYNICYETDKGEVRVCRLRLFNVMMKRELK